MFCTVCGERYTVEVYVQGASTIIEGALKCRCERQLPVVAGVPRILPPEAAQTLVADHAAFYQRHPELLPDFIRIAASPSVRTLRAFGDEWERFPELLGVHAQIFQWYFEGPEPVRWRGLRVLDAGCGMGRWLHFARMAGADVVGMDVSRAIDVGARRESGAADFVQADLRWSPFPPKSFDLVYSLGVLHHLQDPLVGVRELARLVRPGGELRFYVYRTLEGEVWWRQMLFCGVTALRKVTTRLPYAAVHVISWALASVATIAFLRPRRVLRRWRWGDRLTCHLPLVQYSDVPFRMVISEQFDRLVAPIERRFRQKDVEAWLREVGFEVEAILPGLGWRVIGRRPFEDQLVNADH